MNLPDQTQRQVCDLFKIHKTNTTQPDLAFHPHPPLHSHHSLLQFPFLPFPPLSKNYILVLVKYSCLSHSAGTMNHTSKITGRARLRGGQGKGGGTWNGYKCKDGRKRDGRTCRGGGDMGAGCKRYEMWQNVGCNVDADYELKQKNLGWAVGVAMTPTCRHHWKWSRKGGNGGGRGAW